jgi:hypothetical protein
MLSIHTLALGLFAVSVGIEATPSPPKINLMSRKAFSPRSSTYIRKRWLSAANVPLANFYQGTDLQWFGNISVGTPPQEIPVVFDTGSETLEFVSTQCGSPCTNQFQFDTSKSSTYKNGGNISTISFTTGAGVDPVQNDDYKLTLLTGSDVVSVGGLNAGNVSFYTIIDQTPKFNIDPFSGIQGMSSRAQGFFDVLVRNGLPALFSLYLTPLKDGHAELTIGGVDHSKFQGELTYSPLASSSDPLWRLMSPQISVNGKTTSSLQQSRSVIFDSGTSNMLFDTKTTEAIYSIISPDIKANSDEPGTYGIACNKIPSLPAKIDIEFMSTTGCAFNLTIPSSELSVGPFANDPSTCQTLINAYDGLSVAGGSLLKHYYSVWDVSRQRVGFADNGL